jgi:uncharacterized membrane protein YgcG
MGGAPAFLVDTLLSRAWVRAVVILIWLFFIIDGLRRYRPFHDNLVTGSSAPAGSQSAVAANIYSDYFGQSPLTLTIMATSLDGTPIINTTRVGSPFAPYGTTYLTAAASNASAALEAIAAEQLNASCVYTFTSFWQQGSGGSSGSFGGNAELGSGSGWGGSSGSVGGEAGGDAGDAGVVVGGATRVPS